MYGSCKADKNRCERGQCETASLEEECEEPPFGDDDPASKIAAISTCVGLGKCAEDEPCDCVNNYCTKPWYVGEDGNCRQTEVS